MLHNASVPFVYVNYAGDHFGPFTDMLSSESTEIEVREIMHGFDLKVYVVEDRVFAVRKPFSTDSFTRPGRPCAVPTGVGEIARRCGRVFGLGLYGLDLVETEGGPVVVDLNTFPGYKGVPGVSLHIADYIARYALGEAQLPPATLPADRIVGHRVSLPQAAGVPGGNA